MSDNINIVIADKNFDTKVLNGLLVKSEMNANTINIEFPKVYEMESLENKIFVIKTINANGVYFEEILPKTISENKIVLTWKIGSEYTSVGGLLKVAIFAEGGNYALGTKTSKIIVESSPQFTAPISPEYVFEKYLKEIRVRSESASNSAEQSLKILKDMNSKIVDDFTSTEKDKALSANKGRELNNRINNIVGQAGTSNTEIVDARNSPERNTIYATLKDRLDAVDGDIFKSKFSAPATATAPIITLPNTAVKGKMEGSLKGNTLYNAVTNGDFRNGISGWSAVAGASISASNNILTVSAIASGSTGVISSEVKTTPKKWFVKIRINKLQDRTIMVRVARDATANVIRDINFATGIGIKDLYFTLSESDLSEITTGFSMYIRVAGADVGKIMEIDGNSGIFAIPISGTTYTDWTADQLNNLITGYWEGLGSSNPVRAKAVGNNILDDAKIKLNTSITETGKEVPASDRFCYDFTRVKPNTTYSFNGTSGRLFFYDKDKSFIARTSSITPQISPSDAFYVRAFGTTSTQLGTSILGEGSIATPYEPYTETELFCPVELGSVPSGVQDEFTFDGKYIQRTREVSVDLTAIADQTNVALAVTGAFLDNSPFVRPLTPNVIVGGREQIPYTSPAQVDSIENVGKYYTMDNQKLYLIFAKGTTLEQAKLALVNTKVRYQIATPKETQYPASNLISEPSGNICVESAIKVVRPYTTNIVTGVKIKNLISVTKVDGENRVPILLSLVNVAVDRLSATILNASSGDMYELEYETFGATLPTLEYSYPSNLNAQVQGNTEGLKDIDQTLKDFINYQKVANLQFDMRIALLEGGH